MWTKLTTDDENENNTYPDNFFRHFSPKPMFTYQSENDLQ